MKPNIPVKVFPSREKSNEMVKTLIKERHRYVEYTSLTHEGNTFITPEFRFLAALKEAIRHDPLGVYPNITSIIYTKFNMPSESGYGQLTVHFTALVTYAGTHWTRMDQHVTAANNQDQIEASHYRRMIANAEGIFRGITVGHTGEVESILSRFHGLIDKVYDQAGVDNDGRLIKEEKGVVA